MVKEFKVINFKDMKISFFKNTYGDKYDGDNTVDIGVVLDCIKNGGLDGIIRQQIEHIRALPDQTQRNHFKKQLPVIMWQGIFESKRDAGLQSLSSLVCIDIDHKTEYELQQLWYSLTKEPWVYAIFRSPSGDGYKVLVKTDNLNPALYKICYRQIEKYFQKQYNIAPDPNCAPLSQGCFLSYDPNIYVNNGVSDWHFVYNPTNNQTASPTPAQPKVSGVNPFLTQLRSMCSTYSSDDVIIKYLDAKYKNFPDNYKDGHRTMSIFIQAKEMCECGIEKENALEYLKENFLPTGYDSTKLEKEVENAYTNFSEDFGSKRDTYNRH